MNDYIMCLILFLLLIFMIIYTFELKTYIFDYLKLYRNNILLVGILLISTFSILTVMAKPEGESLALEPFKQIQSLAFNETVKNISFNKVVIVGDSRMEFIYNKKDELDIPSNFIFDAKSGAMIEWLLEIGKPKLEDILDNRDNKYTYHVVFNLGVNDLNSSTKPEVLADDYFDVYEELVRKYSNVKFYFLSVNPIDEEAINKGNKRTNEKIELFNTEIHQRMSELNKTNVNYCDSYNRLDFNLPDGLHYDNETDQKIIDYIARDCVQFK